MEMDWLGQTARHSPQPLQRSLLTTGRERPPVLSRKRMATDSQASLQLLQTMPWRERHCSVMRTSSCQAGVSKWAGTSNASCRQALTHSPQNRQAPRVKSICGKPPAPVTMICSGQAGRQSSQRSQCWVKRASSLAQGGRILRRRPLRSPRRNWTLSMDVFNCSPRSVSSLSPEVRSDFDADQVLIGK